MRFCAGARCNWTYQAGKWQLSNEQLCAALVLADLTQCDGAGPKAVPLALTCGSSMLGIHRQQALLSYDLLDLVTALSSLLAISVIFFPA